MSFDIPRVSNTPVKKDRSRRGYLRSSREVVADKGAWTIVRHVTQIALDDFVWAYEPNPKDWIQMFEQRHILLFDLLRLLKNTYIWQT